MASLPGHFIDFKNKFLFWFCIHLHPTPSHAIDYKKQPQLKGLKLKG